MQYENHILTTKIKQKYITSYNLSPQVFKNCVDTLNGRIIFCHGVVNACLEIVFL